MTAAPSSTDLQRVPHHCYGFVDLKTRDFNVQDYRKVALKAIADIHSRGKLPIVCGGTNYYIEALLFETCQDSLQEDFDEAFDTRSQEILAKNPGLKDLMNAFKVNIPVDDKQAIEDVFPSELCHQLLCEVDP